MKDICTSTSCECMGLGHSVRQAVPTITRPDVVAFVAALPARRKAPATSTFGCLECGRKFRSASAAERATLSGCPGCGGVDIDII